MGLLGRRDDLVGGRGDDLRRGPRRRWLQAGDLRGRFHRAARPIVGAGLNRSIGLVDGGRIVYSKEHLKSPAELHVANADGSGETRINSINLERLESIAFGEPEQMSFRGAGGDMVFAYIVKPANFDPAKK
ncbi:MAG: hypothetical protein R2862_05560 [Thermoanaerobaculia bacterium]